MRYTPALSRFLRPLVPPVVSLLGVATAFPKSNPCDKTPAITLLVINEQAVRYDAGSSLADTPWQLHSTSYYRLFYDSTAPIPRYMAIAVAPTLTSLDRALCVSAPADVIGAPWIVPLPCTVRSQWCHIFPYVPMPGQPSTDLMTLRYNITPALPGPSRLANAVVTSSGTKTLIPGATLQVQRTCYFDGTSLPRLLDLRSDIVARVASGKPPGYRILFRALHMRLPEHLVESLRTTFLARRDASWLKRPAKSVSRQRLADWAACIRASQRFSDRALQDIIATSDSMGGQVGSAEP